VLDKHSPGWCPRYLGVFGAVVSPVVAPQAHIYLYPVSVFRGEEEKKEELRIPASVPLQPGFLIHRSCYAGICHTRSSSLRQE